VVKLIDAMIKLDEKIILYLQHVHEENKRKSSLYTQILFYNNPITSGKSLQSVLNKFTF